MRLALVSVPVKLFAATQSGARITLHQIHEPSGKRVRYQKVAPGIGPVDTDEIVRGVEVDDGRYVLLDPDEIEDLKIEAKSTLDLVQFVKQGEIDPIWFERPYYVVPDGDVAEEAYRVLRDALRLTNRLGIGQFVMRKREYIAAVKPCGSGLLLETMRFSHEVRNAAPFFSNVEDEEPDDELLELATDLIERKSAPFEPDRFTDRYTEALGELIAAKAERRKPAEIGEEKAPAGGAEVINLVDALKRSVKNTGRSSRSRGGSGKKSSGSRSKKAS
jgi:DNA end-binding protein Ku